MTWSSRSRLRLDGGDDARVAMAVGDHPPRRDAHRGCGARPPSPARRPRAPATSSMCGCSACCVNGCQTGCRLSRSCRDRRRKSSARKLAAKASRKVASVSGSMIGRRPSRRTPPISAIVRSESAFSSPTKAMPSSGICRRFRASIDSRLWLMVPSRVEATRTTGAPQRANSSICRCCRDNGTSRPPAPSMTTARLWLNAGALARPSMSISTPSRSAAKCGEAAVVRR